MTENPKEHYVNRKFYDSFVTPNMKRVVKEEDIAAFCKPCDFLGEDNICKLVLDRGDQLRYAARNVCGWAAVGGQGGIMRTEGFEPFNKIDNKTS